MTHYPVPEDSTSSVLLNGTYTYRDSNTRRWERGIGTWKKERKKERKKRGTVCWKADRLKYGHLELVGKREALPGEGANPEAC